MKLNLTKEQEHDICYLIDDWYLEWKNQMTDEGVQHRLGVAKEELKALICSINIHNE